MVNLDLVIVTVFFALIGLPIGAYMVARGDDVIERRVGLVLVIGLIWAVYFALNFHPAI